MLMLYDKNFLLNLDKYPHKVVYARVTALTFQEAPIERIEGRVTQGSINVDGASAVRRSCSLTISASNFNYNEYYWGLNTKFKLEVGLENHVDSNYPEIIWFPQGIFLITSFNMSRSTTNFNIAIQGKDKMCLLNGEVGGSLESSVDFGTIEQEDSNGNWVMTKVPIQDIIRNMVHTYAGEPYHNIIINDLDTYGLELMEYRYDLPMFLYRQVESPIYDNILLGGETKCRVFGEEDNFKEPIPIVIVQRDKFGQIIKDEETGEIETVTKEELQLSELPLEYLEFLTDRLITGNNGSYKIQVFLDSKKEWSTEFYYFAKVEYGQTAGYRFTDLVYAGDLIANIGESLTSVLDKIKNMLVEFEYFYNLEGQFVFQKKRSLKEAIWQFNIDDKFYTPPEYSYEFYGSNLIKSFNNNPNLLNLRNDYSIWGEKESLSGAKVPIHLRYAIDKKPTAYHPIWTTNLDDEQIEAYNNKYGTTITGRTKAEAEKLKVTTEDWDWREIIYQMALDYYKYNFLEDFELKVALANPDDYPTGRTGYEQYYVDMQGFWRELYNPEIVSKRTNSDNKIKKLENDIVTTKGKILQYTKTIYEYDEERILHNIDNWKKRLEDSDELKKEKEKLVKLTNELERLKEEFDELDNLMYDYYSADEGKLKYWNKLVYQQPDRLNFWFDFLDTEGELQQFSVKAIGSRSKAINDTNIKSIYFRETPSVIYAENTATQQELEKLNAETGYKFIQIPTSYDNMFSLSAQGIGAKDKLDDLLYQHGYCVESVTISTVPIYHLEPNTRIYVHDDEANLDGDYIVSKITIPLLYNGNMQITATKAAENNIL